MAVESLSFIKGGQRSTLWFLTPYRPWQEMLFVRLGDTLTPKTPSLMQSGGFGRNGHPSPAITRLFPCEELREEITKYTNFCSDHPAEQTVNCRHVPDKLVYFKKPSRIVRYSGFRFA